MTKAKSQTKTSMFKDYEVCPDLAKDGIWIDYDESGFKIKLAAMGTVNKEAVKYAERERVRLGIKSDSVKRIKKSNDSKLMTMITNVLIGCLIKEWKVQDENDKWVDGIEGIDGDILPVTEENIRKTFELLPVLRDELIDYANDYGHYLKRDLEKSAKN